MNTLSSCVLALALATAATACVAADGADAPDEASESADVTVHPATTFTLTVFSLEGETRVQTAAGHVDLCDGSCTFTYAAGSVLTVSPTTLSFRPDCLMWVGWNDACAGQGSTCTLTLNSNLGTSTRWGRIAGCKPD